MLGAFGYVVTAGSHVARHVGGLLSSFYDVYISIPLRIERIVRDDDDDAEIYERYAAATGSRPQGEATR
jgi:hypothetical protein